MRQLFIIILLVISSAVTAQEYAFRGVVKDAQTKQPILGAHIRNITQGTLVITAVNGAFKIPVQPGDSIRMTYIGFKTIEQVIPTIPDPMPRTYYLEIGSTELPEVTVTVFPEYWRFKQMVLDTEPVDSVITFDLPKVVVYEPPTAFDMQNPDLSAPTIGIPFSLDGFTKKGKERKKLQKIMERKSLIETAYSKFSRDWVAHETQLKGDELTDFIVYCKFTPKYLAETPLFEIHKEMMALLDEFKSDQQKSGKERFSPGA